MFGKTEPNHQRAQLTASLVICRMARFGSVVSRIGVWDANRLRVKIFRSGTRLRWR